MRVAWNKGKTLEQSHKDNISKALKGRVAWNKGKKLTEDHKLNISQGKKHVNS